MAPWDAIVVKSFLVSWDYIRVPTDLWLILIFVILIWTVWVLSGGNASSSAGIVLTVVVSSLEIIVIIPIEGAAMGLSVPLSVL